MSDWNMWHGCHKISPGCLNCYMYRGDAKYNRDSTVVYKTSDFNLPIRRNKNGEYSLKSPDTVYSCFTSDFFVEDADNWRRECWHMMAARQDLNFFIITKRPHRFYVELPWDWGDGYNNVTIAVTCENQEMADIRLKIYKNLPIKHKVIVCEPLLSKINLLPCLDNSIEQVVVGGESGNNARICDFEWVMDIHNQCIEKGIKFNFRQTGANLLYNGKAYRIKRPLQHIQAKKAHIDIDLIDMPNTYYNLKMVFV